MANRNLTIAQQLANQQQSVRYFELLYLRVRVTGTSSYEQAFYTNAPFDIDVTGTQANDMGLPTGGSAETFTALGGFLQFSTVEEAADFQINNVTVALGGLKGQALPLFLENQYIDQPIKIYRVWYNEDNEMVGDPVMIFDGRIDKPVVSDDPKGSVTVGCSASSQWVDYQRRAGRHTNNGEQQFYYPGDTGFKFAAQTIRDLKWGG